MSPEEFAKLPMQIVITFTDNQYKVTIMSAVSVTDVQYYDSFEEAVSFIRAHATALRSS